MDTFIHGLELSEAFYREAARPIIDRLFPGLRYSAALIGPGSEVLGFDTPISSDHHWGPRFWMFLHVDDYADMKEKVSQAFRENLPYTFRGYSVNFGPPDQAHVRLMEYKETGLVEHMIEIETTSSFLSWYLGWDGKRELTVEDWLLFSEHRLLTFSSGKVFYDGLRELEPLRKTLGYYPRDVWLYLMAVDWEKIGQEEPFVGRTGDVGDDLGSRVIAARLTQYLMHLCFLMERRYAPYSKWLGTAFARLDCAPYMLPLLRGILTADGWEEREQYLGRACEVAVGILNELHVMPSLPARVSPFYSRPYKVIHSDEISAAIRRVIPDERLRHMYPPIGSVNQFIDSVKILTTPPLCQGLKGLFQLDQD